MNQLECAKCQRPIDPRTACQNGPLMPMFCLECWLDMDENERENPPYEASFIRFDVNQPNER